MRGKRPHVVIAGQMPPPVGGQNINIKRVHDLLAAETDLEVSHLRFQFTPTWDGARRAGLRKVLELFRVWGRALRLRMKRPIDFLLFPAGGPHLVPIIRDWLLLPVMALVSRRVVVHFRAAGLAERLARSPGWFSWICRRVYGGLAQEAIVLLPYGRRDAEAAGFRKITVIPNGFEDQAGGFVRAGGTEARDLELLSVGHVCADKGTPELIRAFGRLAADHPGIRLRLVGEVLAPYTAEQLRRDVEATGVADRIECAGLLQGEELAEAYRRADLFVFSSVAPYESFGMVLIEAMQWSLPIVVTDWRGNVSVCGDDFGGVVAVDPDRNLAVSLHDALRKALEGRESWGTWGSQNRRIYEQRYTINRLRENLRTVIGV